MKCDTWCKPLWSCRAFVEAESVSLLGHHTCILSFRFPKTSGCMLSLGFEELWGVMVP